MIVLDASVIIKWFQPESDSEKALHFEKEHLEGKEPIAVPDLVFYEVANVLRYQKRVDTKSFEDAVDILSEMELQVFIFSPLEFKEVFSFAREYDVSIYDVVYVILAKRMNCTFITADKKLYQKFKEFPWVNLL